MFDEVSRGASGQGSARLWRLLRAAVGSRLVQLFAALVAVAILGAGLYGTWLYQQAWSIDCESWAAIDPSMAELIGVRQRLATYQQDPAPDAHLTMSGDELTYLFGERAALQMHTTFVGERTVARLAMPVDGGCYNVVFEGEVEVRDGLARLRPERLVVGQADLTDLLGGRTLVVGPERIPDEHMAEALANTEHLVVRDGMARVRLSNRWDLW